MIQILTATGERPEAWRLCIKWMRNQDYEGRVKWIIVDDGRKPSQEPNIENWQTVIVRPQPFWSQGQNTQARNLRAGLEFVTDDDPLIVVEDDEHYKLGWLSRCVEELMHHEMAGQKISRKYNLKNRRGREILSPPHSSLSSTAMIGAGTRKFRRVAQHGRKLMDLHLWKVFRGHLFDGHYVTGIKCMPGRKGIDSGHRSGFGEIEDSDGSLLRQWIGDDAKHYQEFM